MRQIILDKDGGWPCLKLVAGHAQNVNYQITYITPGNSESEPINNENTSRDELQNCYSLDNHFDSLMDANHHKIRYLILVTGTENDQYSINFDLIQGDKEHKIHHESGELPMDGPARDEVEIIIQ